MGPLGTEGFPSPLLLPEDSLAKRIVAPIATIRNGNDTRCRGDGSRSGDGGGGLTSALGTRVSTKKDCITHFHGNSELLYYANSITSCSFLHAALCMELSSRRGRGAKIPGTRNSSRRNGRIFGPETGRGAAKYIRETIRDSLNPTYDSWNFEIGFQFADTSPRR